MLGCVCEFSPPKEAVILAQSFGAAPAVAQIRNSSEAAGVQRHQAPCVGLHSRTPGPLVRFLLGVAGSNFVLIEGTRAWVLAFFGRNTQPAPPKN